MCTIFLADDEPGIRQLYRLMLGEDDTIAVVGEAGDGCATVTGVREHQPDVVLLDLSMPVLDGLEALPLLAQAAPGTRVIVASAFARDRMWPMVEPLGAVGYFEKGDAPDSLLALVSRWCDAASC